MACTSRDDHFMKVNVEHMITAVNTEPHQAFAISRQMHVSSLCSGSAACMAHQSKCAIHKTVVAKDPAYPHLAYQRESLTPAGLLVGTKNMISTGRQ